MKQGVVDVVIVHHNTLELTSRCIESLVTPEQREYIARLIVVDNASTDRSGHALAERYPFVTIFHLAKQIGYAAACNYGARQGSAQYVLLSNSDVEYSEDFLPRMLMHMEKYPAVAVCCPAQKYPDGRFQRSWGYFPGWGEILATIAGMEFLRNRWPSRSVHWRAVPYCDGAALFVRRSAYEQIGGMNEQFAFFGEDADLCYRFWQQEWHCHHVPSIQVLHHRGGTRNTSPERLVLYEQANLSAKLHFVQLHHAYGHRFVSLGYRVLYAMHTAFYFVLYLLGFIDSSTYRTRKAINIALCAHLRTKHNG
ncbi:MAG: glycosyltransferase family 2 protein [Bacteroidota bacterium]|nr:glycosyltransferase family 2 protein [Candidatus Kapabacteria bacterium]MDW8074194.1 glycosyltransferase family 2 protein [Bacteroidota bacterium]MDW8271330.1 glycosyltransferase family 2 protein [Bacteroidota bacterium]